MTQTDFDSPRSPRAFLTAGILGIVLCGLSTSVLAAIGATVERELRIPHAGLGLIQSGFFIGNGSASALVLLVPWRHTPRALALWAFACLTAGNLLSSIPLFACLLGGRILMGWATSWLFLAVSELVVHGFPQRQNALLNLTHGAMAGGSALGVALTSPLIALLHRWPRVTLLLSVPAGLAFVLALSLRLHVAPSPVEPHGLPDALTLLRRGIMLVAAPFMFMYIVAEAAVVVFTPVLAQTKWGAGQAAAAGYSTAFIVGIVAGRLVATFSGKAQARRGQLVFLTLGGCTAALAALALGLSPLWTGALLVVAGALAGPTAPMSVAYAVQHLSGAKRQVLIVANLAMCSGGALGMAGVGLLSDRFGLMAGLATALVVFMATAIPVMLFRPPAAMQSPARG